MEPHLKPSLYLERKKNVLRLFLFFRLGKGRKETHSLFCCRLSAANVSAAVLLKMGFSYQEDFLFARRAAKTRTDPENLAELYEDNLF